jgi:hypothetical protein
MSSGHLTSQPQPEYSWLCGIIRKWCGRTYPEELGHRSATILVVINLDLVLFVREKRNESAVESGGLVDKAVDNKLPSTQIRKPSSVSAVKV